MKAFPDRLASVLERGLARAYLVAGPESLLVEESCDQIRVAARQAGVHERVVIQADARFDWDRLGQSTETGSLFATRRLVELRLPSGKPGQEGGNAIREWLSEPSDDVLLIKCDAWEMASEKTVWFRAVDEQGVFVPCWTIKPQQLPKWIVSRLSDRGLSVDRAGAEFLTDRLEGNALAAAQEVERLALLYPKGHRLTLAELKEAVSDHARFDAFRLVELTLLGQPGPALRCVRGLIEAETAMPAVVSALASELKIVSAYRVIRKTQSAEQAFGALRVWPSRQGPVEVAAKRLSTKELGWAMERLSELDRMSKSNAAHRFWVGVERLCVALASDRQSGFFDAGVSAHVA